MLDLPGKLLTRKFHDNPIFVVGAGRSGTSALLNALGAHPLIFSVGGESPFLSHIGRLTYPFEFTRSREQEYNLKTLRVSKDDLYQLFRQLSFKSAMGKHYGLRTLLESLVASRGGLLKTEYWCAKVYPDCDEYQGLIKIYPEAKFVYIVRNGCDVVNSRSHFPPIQHQAFHIHCENWVKLVEKYAYLADMPQAIQVHHETMTTDPEKMFRRIFSFVGIDYDDGPTSLTKSVIVHPLDQPTQEVGNVKNLFKERPPAHADWTEEQKRTFKEICGEAMSSLGYDIPF